MLSRDMQMLVDAGIVDIEKVLEMMRCFGGLNIHIPTLSGDILQSLIIDEYDGTNVKQLAIKYRRSERTIYAILSRKVKPCKQLDTFNGES